MTLVIVALIAALLSTLLTRVYYSRTIRTLNVEHDKQMHKDLHDMFTRAYDEGVMRGRTLESRERAEKSKLFPRD